MSGQSSNDDILLFVMRHGEAEAPRYDDKNRQLTDVGRYQVNRAAVWLIDNYCTDARLDLALVSPYKRTQQSCDELCHSLEIQKVETFNDITPDGNASEVSEYLAARTSLAMAKGKPINRLILVSHMPLVSYLVDAVCQSYTTSLFSTASVAVVKYNVKLGRGSLVQHYHC